MANLTLSIDDHLLKDARRLALEQDTSVNRLVRDYLETLVATHSRKEEAKRWLPTKRFNYQAGNFDRVDLYER